MRHLLQLASALLLTAALAPAQLPPAQSQPQARPGRKDKSQREDVEWLWQYTPDDRNKDGRENDLVQDPRFRPFLDQFLTSPQTFWGPAAGKPKSLADAAVDYLSIPDKVSAEESRYIAVTGHVFHFAPARGLLWIDLNGKHHLVAFAAIDWTTQGRPTTDPNAEYTLWLFPNDALTVEGPGTGAQHVPAALTRSIGRWAAQPLPGSGLVQNITHAVLVDPDGTPHEVPPATLGIHAAAKPAEAEAPALAPRN